MIKRNIQKEVTNIRENNEDMIDKSASGFLKLFLAAHFTSEIY